jgi:hypothetical protein
VTGLSKQRVRYAAEREHPMMDIILQFIAVAFFVLSIGYAYACDRL